MKSLFLLLCSCVGALAQGLSYSGTYITLSGKTNQLSDTGSTLVYTGANVTIGPSGVGQIFSFNNSTTADWYLQSSDTTGYVDINAGKSFSDLALNATGAKWTLDTHTNTATGRLQLTGIISSATNVVIIDPDRPDNVGPRYKLGSSRTQTSGYHVALSNNETNILTVGFNGNVRIGMITKAQKTAMTAENGMIVYQTDNTPGFRVYVNGTWFILSTAADP